MKVSELFIKLGVVADTAKAKEFFNVLQDGKRVLFGVGAMAVGTSLGIGAMLDKSIQTSIALANFTAETGLSAQALQAWQHVGEGVGMTADEMTGAIQSLNSSLIRAKAFGEHYPAFRLLGINPLMVNDVWDLIEKLRQAQEAGILDPALFTDTMRDLAGTGKMSKVLTADFNRLANRGAIIPQEWIDGAIRFNAEMKRLGQTITYFFASAFSKLEPTFTKMVASLTEWVKINEKALIKNITEFSKMVAGGAKAVLDLFGALNKVVNSTVGWETAIKALVVAFALLNPYFAAIALLAMAIQEIAYLLEGEWESKLKKQIQGMASAFKDVGSMIAKNVAEGIKQALSDYFDPAKRKTTSDILAEKRKAAGTPGEQWDQFKQSWGNIFSGYMAAKFGVGESANLIEGRKSWMPELSMGREVSTPVGGPVTLNLTQNIQSGADAREIAEISLMNLKRVFNQTSLQGAL